MLFSVDGAATVKLCGIALEVELQVIVFAFEGEANGRLALHGRLSVGRDVKCEVVFHIPHVLGSFHRQFTAHAFYNIGCHAGLA